MSVKDEIKKMIEMPTKEQLIETVVSLVQSEIYIPMFIRGLRQEHDVLMNEAVPYYPMFTDLEEVPEDYQRKFFFVKEPFEKILENLDTERITVNPFSQNMILDEDIIKIILESRVEQ